MIGRRAALLKNLNITSTLLGDVDQREEEIVAGDVARATAGYQDSAWREDVQRRAVEPRVARKASSTAARLLANLGGSSTTASNRSPAAFSACKVSKASPQSNRKLAAPFRWALARAWATARWLASKPSASRRFPKAPPRG